MFPFRYWFRQLTSFMKEATPSVVTSIIVALATSLMTLTVWSYQQERQRRWTAPPIVRTLIEVPASDRQEFTLVNSGFVDLEEVTVRRTDYSLDLTDPSLITGYKVDPEPQHTDRVTGNSSWTARFNSVQPDDSITAFRIRFVNSRTRELQTMFRFVVRGAARGDSPVAFASEARFMTAVQAVRSHQSQLHSDDAEVVYR